jgi:NAD(P)-dependent dehydrogenase (short-subunit alcohol dehydrogenase family)
LKKKIKNVLITGAGKRIGSSIAKSLAANNWNIALHYNSSEKETKKLSIELQETYNVKTVCIQADLSDLKQLKKIIPTVTKSIGHISCLINNAASFEYDSIYSLSSDSWDMHMNTNIRAPLFLSQSFVENIPKKINGNIINIIDQRVWNLTPHFTTYTLSKSALWALTQTLALSLSPNIRVNAIGPGPTIKSKMQTTKEFKDQYQRMPLPVPVTLEEISQFINLIINSPSLTGQMIALDGGQHLGWAQTDKNQFKED